MLATVLFVDDEPNVTEGLERALFAEPFHILTASSATEALDILAREHVDVIVSDEQMPGMSGSQLLCEVRGRHPKVKRIILTGHASMEATLRAINDVGVFKYLRKPCAPGDVAATIHDAMGVAPNPALERTFERALGHLELFFQPILSLKDREAVALEALTHCSHSQLPSIGALLSAAEALGRAHDLDTAIHERIARAVPRLPPALDLFVNVHPASLSHELLWSDDAPLAPHFPRIVLEITERACLDNDRAVRSFITAVRSRGGRLALDDLGAGHSALATIARVTPDVIKLDMSLIRGIDTSPTVQQVVATMIDLGRRLEVRVVAEGVETRGEAEQLELLGCELVQGFYFARPTPLDVLTNREKA